jgi:hypothetical protein
MKLEELEKNALELPDRDRAVLAATLLGSLPATLSDSDDGLSEARRRSEELDRDAGAGVSWNEIKRELGR